MDKPHTNFHTVGWNYAVTELYEHKSLLITQHHCMMTFS